MKILTAAILAGMIVAVSVIVLPACGYGLPSVGVKAGDWIDYSVDITGTPPPIHNVTWMRIEVLQAQGAAFPVNLTVRYRNGTLYSSIWKFNFAEGNEEGWLIIPSNLEVGESFYDSSKFGGNITIQGQEQKTVMGASRTVTYGSDSLRTKEWDKATGVFTQSSENLGNWSAYASAIATNMWSPEILGLNQTEFFGLVAAIIMLVLLVSFSMVVVAKRKRAKRLTSPSPLQGKIKAFTIITIILATTGAVAAISVFESKVSMSFHEINLFMQTLWTALILMSMWFRSKGNYFLHGITMMVVVGATVVSFSAVLVMSPPTGVSMQSYFSSPLNLAQFISHAILSIPAIIFGVWLVVLWRPASTSFATKSKRIAQITAVLWVLSYLVGVLGYVVGNSHFWINSGSFFLWQRQNFQKTRAFASLPGVMVYLVFIMCMVQEA